MKRTTPPLKIIIKSSLLYYILLYLSGCGLDHSDPQKVVNAYLEATEKRDYKNCYEYISTKSKEYVTEDEFIISYKSLDSAKSYKRSFIIYPLERDVDKPTYRRFKVGFMAINKADTIRDRGYFTLTNENEKWKICWVYTLLKQAEDKFNDGNYTEPIKICEKVIEINPYAAWAYTITGWCYKNDNLRDSNERNAGMLRNFKYALAIEPERAANYNNLGAYYSDVGEYDLAREQTLKAIHYETNEKDKAYLYKNLSCDYGDKDSLAMAMIYAKKAIEVDSNYAGGWERIGFLQYFNHNYAEANKSFEKALTLPITRNYEKGILYNEYALNLKELKNWSKAKEFALKGLEIDPTDEELKKLYNEICLKAK